MKGVALRWVLVPLALLVFCAILRAAPASAQELVVVRGQVTRAGDAAPLPGIRVTVQGTSRTAMTQADGRYTVHGVPPGEYVVAFDGMGSRRRELRVTIGPGAERVLDAVLEPEPVLLTEMVVEGASRAPERLVDAPAAVVVIPRTATLDYSVTGQPPAVLMAAPGVDVTQSDVNDFNVNTRGFNSSLTRRMLVLQDGRDTSVPLLSFQEWNAMSVPLSDMVTVEVVRGPGSALYGANAFSGVLNIRTPAARDVIGGRLSLGGGEPGSLHGDLRYAGLLNAGRVGYKVNLGYNRTDTWTLSRTSFDRGDLRREYDGATDSAVPDFREAAPVVGQRVDPGTGSAIGEPDPVTNAYGSARLDYYAPGGSVATFEAGASLAENHTVVSGIGRIQIDEVLRPWARAVWGREDLHLMFWYSGRDTRGQPHISLGSGAPIQDESAMYHAEAQTNRRFAGERARLIAGVSGRNVRTDTKTTLVREQDDARSDWNYAGYAQLEYDLTGALRLVGALRMDDGTLFDPQLSPRAALVYTLREGHSLRATVNRAFQTPTQLERFLYVPAAPPANFGQLEAGLRASPLGPALENVPQGALFTNSNAVPVLALGNRDLDVEAITSYELGYKGQLGDRLYLSFDAYYSRMRDFVTDLLPGANPVYAAWTAPLEVPASSRPALEMAVRNALVGAGQNLAAAGLSRLDDGATAIVLSYANAGEADTYGVEFAGTLQWTPELSAGVTYTRFEFDIDPSSVLPGDELKPNTPRNKGSFDLTYQSRSGLEGGIGLVLIESFDWAAGVFSGTVPSRQTFDARLGYRINANLRVHALATNVFDQKRYHLFGGSLVGRRVLAALTAAF